MRLIKQLRWGLVGAGAGAALAAAHLLRLSNEPVGGPGYISLAEFQVARRLPPVMGKPRLRKMTLHHRPYIELLTAEMLDPSTLTYRPIRVAIPPAEAPHAWVAGNTAALNSGDGPAAVRDAWWESSAVVLGTGMALGLLFFGLAIPAAVGRKSGRADGSSTLSHGVPKDPARLQNLPDETASEVPPTEPEAEPDLQPSATPLPADEPPLHWEEPATTKSYAGEFYPVEQRGRRAFSLIELLVVIGVIAVLLSLLLAGVRSARLGAQTTRCAAQLRQLGQAFHDYANDNRGSLPAWSGWHTWPPGATDDDPKGVAWTIEMIPYIGNPDSRVYNCPAFPAPFRYRNYFLAAQWSGRSSRTDHKSMKFSDIALSDRFVLSGDKTQLGLYPPPLGTSEHHSDDADPDDCGTSPPVLAWPWDRGGFYMHRGGNNVLFGDTHVALMSKYDPHLMTFNPHRIEDWADVTAD